MISVLTVRVCARVKTLVAFAVCLLVHLSVCMLGATFCMYGLCHFLYVRLVYFALLQRLGVSVCV